MTAFRNTVDRRGRRKHDVLHAMILAGLQQRPAAGVHLHARDVLHPPVGDVQLAGGAGDVGDVGDVACVRTIYMTDVVSRASKVMARCVKYKA